MSVNEVPEMQQSKVLPSIKRTLKVDITTWNSLKDLKKEDETFDDVIRELLNQRTKTMGNENLGMIAYRRKIAFLQMQKAQYVVGVECEYNDIKGKERFTLDLKLKKIFFGKRIMNPSEFFGVPSKLKHLSPPYLSIYLQCVAMALRKEIGVRTYMVLDGDFEKIVNWRRIYHYRRLSEESFASDVEEPLRLSEEELPTEEQEAAIRASPAAGIWGA